MITLLKWLAGFLLTSILLIALAALILPRVIEPNDYRENIASVVKQETGRELKLEGDLSVSVFPWLGIRTQQLSLSQPAEIGGNMLSVNSAQLRVRLLPLFSKQLEIDTVVLEQPELELVTLKSGIDSFSGLTGNEEPAPPGTDDASTAVALLIQGLELTDGRLVWDDRGEGVRYDVENLQMSTGNLIGDELADLSAGGLLTDASTAEKIAFTLDGQARIDTDTLQLMAQGMKVTLQQGEQALNVSMADFILDQVQGITALGIELNGVVDLASEDDAGAGAAEPAEFVVGLESLSHDLNTTMIVGNRVSIRSDVRMPDLPAVSLTGEMPAITYNTQTTQFSANSLLIDGNIGSRKLNATVPSLQIDLDRQKADIGTMNINSADLSIALTRLNINQLIDNPTAAGNMRIPPFNAARALQQLEIDYQAADSTVLGAVGLQTGFTANADVLDLTNMVLQLDDSSLDGSFSAKNFDNPQLQFDLNLDQLDLDSYLPVDEGSAGSAETTVSGAEALAVPMALLKEVNANGSFKAQRLVSGGLELNDIDVSVVSSPGSLTITPKAQLYDGSLGGEMAFTQNGEQAQLKIQNQIDLVSLAKFLTAADVSDQLSGIGSLGLDIVVDEVDGVQKNSGTIKLLAKNGAIKGVDIKAMLDKGYETYQSFRGKEEAENQADNEAGVKTAKETGAEPEAESGDSQESDETRFAELLGTFKLQDNRLSNDDFQLKAPLFRVSGAGEFDLAAEQIDYLLNVSIVNTTSGQGGEALEKLKGLTIPIRLSGSLLAPSYSLDMKALYKGLLAREVDEKKSEFLEEKLGIEGAGELSTKELLKQIIINEVSKKDRKDESAGHDQGAEHDQSADQQPASENIPASSPTYESQPVDDQSGPAPDIYSDPNRSVTPHNSPRVEKPVEEPYQPYGVPDGVPDGVSEGVAEDEPNGAGQDAAQPAEENQPQDTRTEKEKLRDELTERLLESIFD